MLVILMSFGAVRHLRSPIPLVGGCSLAISAACHPNSNEKDMADKNLKWGVVDKVPGKVVGCNGWFLADSDVEDQDVLHCSLSTGEVISPAELLIEQEKSTRELFA